MNFNRHLELEGKHALLSASSWRWLNDDNESLIKRMCGLYATDVGTILHGVAYKHILHKIKLNKYDKKNVVLELLSSGIPGYIIDAINFDGMFENLMVYTNDAIGFRMTPEVVLRYSNNFFGTADSISFSETDRFLRIHDYKSGVTPAHMEQLLIYAALFCLEYNIKPVKINSELRIYQNNEVLYHNPGPDEIKSVMDKIISLDNYILRIKEEA